MEPRNIDKKIVNDISKIIDELSSERSIDGVVYRGLFEDTIMKIFNLEEKTLREILDLLTSKWMLQRHNTKGGIFYSINGDVTPPEKTNKMTNQTIMIKKENPKKEVSPELTVEAVVSSPTEVRVIWGKGCEESSY